MNLLTNRYKVIAEYPDSTRSVGTVITTDSSKSEEWQQRHCDFFDRYPNLFRKLEWWEERGKEELPQYLKDIKFGLPMKVFKWSDKNPDCFVSEANSDSGYLSYAKQYLPSTEQEYNEFMNFRKQYSDLRDAQNDKNEESNSCI